MDAAEQMSPEHAEITCDDCFFRRADLCAIPGNTPCPTFRPLDGALKLPQAAAESNGKPSGRIAAAAA
jgi:hypothetical protein